MTISISLVNVTMMDLWKIKNDDDDDESVIHVMILNCLNGHNINKRGEKIDFDS